MKRILITLIILLVCANQILASAMKIYDKDGFRLGVCKKNGEQFEAYDLNGKAILKDALNNNVPANELYFYDRNGNLIRFSNEKRTIAPVNIEITEPEHVILKGPIYGNYRRKLQKSL